MQGVALGCRGYSEVQKGAEGCNEVQWGAGGCSGVLPTASLRPHPFCLSQGENLLYCLEVAHAQPALTQGKQDISHARLLAAPGVSSLPALPAPRPPSLSPSDPVLDRGQHAGPGRGATPGPGRHGLRGAPCPAAHRHRPRPHQLRGATQGKGGVVSGTVSPVPGAIARVTPHQHWVIKGTWVWGIPASSLGGAAEEVKPGC